MADDAQRLSRELDDVERQASAQYAPLQQQSVGAFPMLPNGQPAPSAAFSAMPPGAADTQFGAPPTAAYAAMPPPAPAAPFGVGMGPGGAGAIGSAEVPMDMDQGITPEASRAAVDNVLPNGAPAPFYVSMDEGRPELGPAGQALQGYTPPVQPATPGAAPVAGGWYSPSQAQVAALPSQQQPGVDPWFSALTPEEQRAVGGAGAAQSGWNQGQGQQPGPFSSQFGGGSNTMDEIDRIRQRYEQAVRGRYE